MSGRTCSLLCALVVWSEAAAYGQTILHHFNPAGAYPRGSVVSYGGLLYGTTSHGGYYGNGVVYSVDPATSQMVVRASFETGWMPNDLIAVGSYLYGTTYGGGTGYGTLFRFDPSTNLLSTVAVFDSGHGAGPVGRLVTSGGMLYGVTESIPTSGAGTVFRFDTSTGTLSVLAQLGGADTFAYANGGLVLSESLLYGTARSGGDFGAGGIFTVDVNGSSATKFASFNGTTEGGNPRDGLLLIGSFLYGTTCKSDGSGTVFKHPVAGSGFTTLASFGSGTWPVAGLAATGNTLFGVTQSGGTFGLGSIFRVESDSSGFSTITSLDASTGQFPSAQLTVIGSKLYGTTASGGSSSGQGVVFELDPAGPAYEKLSELNATGNGWYPQSGLTPLGSYLYGVTLAGGKSGGTGSIYRLDPSTSGVEDAWLSFSGSGSTYRSSSSAVGNYPYARLVTDGTYLYGAASSGGANGFGSIYKVDPVARTIANLASFDGANGNLPEADLLLEDGTLFGTTRSGGEFSSGTVFKVSTAGGAIVRLASFPNAVGQGRRSEVAMAGGFLYGTTQAGGANGMGSVFKVDASTGAMTTVASFGGVVAGRRPWGGLIVSGGFLWGLTSEGGTDDAGTIYKVGIATGTLTTVLSLPVENAKPRAAFFSDGTYFYAPSSATTGSPNHGTVFKFDPATSAVATLGTFNGPNGGSPYATLMQDGTLLYGTAVREGAYGGGVLFSITKDARPAIAAAPGVNREAGTAAAVATVAAVSDLEDSAGSLQVSATSVPSNIAVTQITNNGGTITASIEVACNATAGANAVTLQVTDSSGASSSATFTVNVTGGCSHVPSPQGVVATALSTALVRLQWQPVSGASEYRVYRSSGNGAFGCINCGGNAYTQTTLDDGVVVANTTYIYRVLAAQGQVVSDPSAPDAATTLMFANDPLVTGAAGPWVSAAHLTELRTAVNAMRAAAGLTPSSFTDGTVAGVPIRAVHVTELRAALNAARSAIGCASLLSRTWPCGLPTLVYTDPSLAAGVQVKAAHFHELRNGTK